MSSEPHTEDLPSFAEAGGVVVTPGNGTTPNTTGSTATIVANLPRHGEDEKEPLPPEAIVPDSDRSETERLDPQPTGPLKLKCGLEVEIKPIRLIETMKLLRIVTHGAGGYLGSLMSDLDMEDSVAFAQQLATMLFLSLPDAETESVDFIRAICGPAGAKEMDDEARLAATVALHEELANPDLNDVVSVVERVVRRESEDLRSLGKRIVAVLNLAKKVGNPTEGPLGLNVPTQKG